MNPNDHLPDLLDQATEALRASPVAPGPADDLIAATLAAFDTRRGVLGPDEIVPDELARKQQRRKRLMRLLKFGGASAGTAAVALAVVFGLASGGTAADDVKKAIRKAEAAKTARLLIEVDTGELAGKITSKSFIDEGKYRYEAEPVGVVVVINSNADNKGVMLMHKMKMYRPLDPEKDELVKQVTKNVRAAMEQFKIPADDKVKGLPDEYLDGRKTKVYEIKGVEVKELNGTADLKIWIDPKTDLPVRSRVITKVGEKTYTATATYLGFDEELDPKLFDTTVPADYKLMPEIKKDK